MSDWISIVATVTSGSVAIASIVFNYLNGKRLKEHETELALYQKLYSKRFDTYQDIERFFARHIRMLKPFGGTAPKLEFMFNHKIYQAFRREHDERSRGAEWLIEGSVKIHKEIIGIFHSIDSAFDEAYKELNFDVYQESEWERISDAYSPDLYRCIYSLLERMQQDYFILHLDTLEHSKTLRARKELGSTMRKGKRRIWHLLTRPIWLSRRQRKIHYLMNNDPEIQRLLGS